MGAEVSGCGPYVAVRRRPVGVGAAQATEPVLPQRGGGGGGRGGRRLHPAALR